MKFLSVVSFVFLSLIIQSRANAGYSPLGIAIAPPIQFPDDKSTVGGLRLNLLWGSHKNVYGLDVGIFGNITTEDFAGIAVSGLFNHTKDGTFILLHGSTGANITTGNTTVFGIQTATLLDWNTGKANIYGIQASLVNIDTGSGKTKVYGISFGGVNRLEEVVGVQLGIINMVKTLRGVQIGVLNFAGNGFSPVFPIINAAF